MNEHEPQNNVSARSVIVGVVILGLAAVAVVGPLLIAFWKWAIGL